MAILRASLPAQRWFTSAAAAVLVARMGLTLDADAVLALARREAQRVPTLTARTAAFAELALRVEGKDGPAAADTLWQLAMETAAAEEDWFDRLMAGRALAARRLRLPSCVESTAEYLRELYRSVPAVEAAPDRALVLRELAQLFTSFDKALAAEALQQAIEAAKAIPEHLVRVTALAETGLVAADLDAALARKALTEASNAWQLASPGTYRDLEAAELVRAWAAVDWQQAVSIASGINDLQARAQALRAAAEELAHRDLDKALVMVQQCDTRELRAIALAAVAAQTVTSRPDLAALLAREAVAAVAEAPQGVRDVVLAAAAAAIAPANPDEAVKLVASIGSEDDRARATVAAAVALARADPGRSLDLVRLLDCPEIAEPVLPEVLYHLAHKDPEAAVAVARTILERYLRVLALLRIYDAMAEQASPAEIPKGGSFLDTP